jgi:3-oxoacyl-[acyl-carrier protein] reductase
MANFELNGRVALVTGASRGLGAAISKRLGSAGAKVAVNTFGNPQMAEGVAVDIQKAGGVANVFRADVRDEADVTRMIGEIERSLGGVDVLVVNATGPQPFVKIEDLTWQHCLDQLEFFVKSPLLLVKAVLPHMKKQRRGRIVQIGSEVFECGVPEFSNYVQAKGAQLGLTRSWATELAQHNITVNLVAPGWIPTERHANDPQSAKDAYAVTVPLRRMGSPQDVGNAVVFLASEEANFITGQKIAVNGGHTLG